MTFFFIFISALILQFFLSWWIIGVIAFFFAAWKASSGWHAFKSAFLAISSLWLIVALFKTIPNQNLLANRVAQMFSLPAASYNWIVMVGITAIIGGVAAGLAGLTGYYFRKALIPRFQDVVSLKSERVRP